MGFRVVPVEQATSININTLTPQMIQDLIICYAYNIPISDVEARHLINQRLPKNITYVDSYGINRHGIEMDYPIMDKSIIGQFFTLLDSLTSCIIDVVMGNYHTGSKVVDYDLSTNTWYYLDSFGQRNGVALLEDVNAWIKGNAINADTDTIDNLKYWVNFIVQRDFYEEGTWMFTYSQGDFESIKPFIDYSIELFIQSNDSGNFRDAIINIQTYYLNL